MLGHSELDMEVSDAGMETAESNNCRGLSKKDGDANGVLAAMQEGVRFSCKDGMEVYRPIYLVNQWIVSGEPVVSKNQRAGEIK